MYTHIYMYAENIFWDVFEIYVYIWYLLKNNLMLVFPVFCCISGNRKMGSMKISIKLVEQKTWKEADSIGLKHLITNTDLCQPLFIPGLGLYYT